MPIDPVIASALIGGGATLVGRLGESMFGARQAETEADLERELLQMRLEAEQEEQKRRQAQWAAIREALTILLRGGLGYALPQQARGVTSGEMLLNAPRPFGRAGLPAGAQAGGVVNEPANILTAARPFGRTGTVPTAITTGVTTTGGAPVRPFGRR